MQDRQPGSRGMSPARVAVITGSTSGIGLAIARRLCRDGFHVVVTGRDQKRGETVVAGLGATATFVPFDLTSPGAAARLMTTAEARLGRIDVVVNNAGIDHTGDLIDVPAHVTQQVFRINTLAAIAVLQEGARRMHHGGSIINITSRLAAAGVPTMAIYSATKGALASLTTAAAVELAPRNIRVNAIAPGMTRTPLYDAWLAQHDDPAETERSVTAAIPLGRLAHPDDIAAAVSFLASDEAAYITGASLPVDGGYTAR
jgi:NAD(P)-dependent dehydrogenase (short-subunit alcohol dehydrogenase family)